MLAGAWKARTQGTAGVRRVLLVGGAGVLCLGRDAPEYHTAEARRVIFLGRCNDVVFGYWARSRGAAAALALKGRPGYCFRAMQGRWV